MKKYFANLCPENAIYPGLYSEKVPDAFLAGNLPLTWSEQQIKKDFNPNSFINLKDYDNEGIHEILQKLKDNNFLKKFSAEPLLVEEPNLDNEISFAEKIFNNF